MPNIDLSKYYFGIEGHEICDVPDEVLAFLEDNARKTHAYYERRRKHRAYYSIDAEEFDISTLPTQRLTHGSNDPQEILEEMLLAERLSNSLKILTPKQRQRLFMYFFMDYSTPQIARHENVGTSSIIRSLQGAIKKLKKYFANGG